MDKLSEEQSETRRILDSQLLKKISIKPVAIVDGKTLFDRDNPRHRYIMED
ncbi:hypothetical protein [Schinkia azotoformans]|uniref:hypothetical protein n=1 Tax=Schinkia azotoformans TaxID=1454 RepID=UPI002DBACE7D|nr:hypothetical protein [Schinkia azotoformans]MEC1757358.1 hypothetical protein [Schinkia azotoformans]